MMRAVSEWRRARAAADAPPATPPMISRVSGVVFMNF
jgi:hypothetical protein